jgi:hypothetical protein
LACGGDGTEPVPNGPAGLAIESFQVDELRVEAGASVHLEWAVRNARSVELFANDRPLDIGGQLVGAIDAVVTERTAFRLQARGRDDQVAHRTVSVEVKTSPSGPIILSFVASPAEIDAGAETSLVWTTANADAVEIFDPAGARIPVSGDAGSGSVDVRPEGDGSYRLVAKGGGEEVQRSLFIKVRGSPDARLLSSHAQVAVGETVTLSWLAKGATRVQLREVGGKVLMESDVSFDGSLEVAPARSTTYELRATGSWRDSVATVQVNVAPLLLGFEIVEKGPIGLRKLATLHWQTAGASEVRLSNLEGYDESITGHRVAEGSARVPMGQRGRSQIAVVGGAGEVTTQEVAAEVLDLPAIGSFTVTPALISQQVQPVRVTVAWSGIRNAESVQLVGDTFGRVGLFQAPFEDGTLELWLRETASLTLTASNGAGAIIREATATLVPLPTIRDFTLFPRHAAVGETIQITWDVAGAEALSLEWNGTPLTIPSAGQGTLPFTVTEPGFFTLTGTNAAGGATQRTRELTVGAPEIRSFTTPQMVFPLGATVPFSWTNQGGVHVELLQDGVKVCEATTVEAVEQGGCTVPGSQAKRSNFTLRLTNGLGQIAERTLSVLVTNGPIIIDFSSDRDLNCPGETVRLSWTVPDDQSGVPPTLQLVDSEGNSYDLSAHNQKQGSVRVPYLGLGTSEFKLTASTPGTFPHESSVHIQMVEETLITVARAEPPVVSAGQNVTIVWDAICADEVVINLGDLQGVPSTKAFTNIAATGTWHQATSNCNSSWGPDDEGCEVINFPSGFKFPFDGKMQTAIKVYTNGVAGFDLGRTGSSFSNQNLPSTSANWANFALFWDDLFFTSSTVGYYSQRTTEGGKEGLIIQWGQFSDGSRLQLVLWEDGTFDYRYGAMNDSGSSATIGYQNLAGTAAHVISFDTSISLSNKAYSFDFKPRPASGSYTFKPNASMEIFLKASGLSEAETSVQVTVQ